MRKFTFILLLIVLLILTSPLVSQKNESHKNSIGNWSKYQGPMSWYAAKTKCKNQGMKLPTLKQLLLAHKNGETKNWEEYQLHWTYDGFVGSYWGVFDAQFTKNTEFSVRCIRR